MRALIPTWDQKSRLYKASEDNSPGDTLLDVMLCLEQSGNMLIAKKNENKEERFSKVWASLYKYFSNEVDVAWRLERNYII